MTVTIDETGSDKKAARVDRTTRRRSRQVTDGDNAVARDSHVRPHPWTADAIDHAAAANQHVQRLGTERDSREKRELETPRTPQSWRTAEHAQKLGRGYAMALPGCEHTHMSSPESVTA